MNNKETKRKPIQSIRCPRGAATYSVYVCDNCGAEVKEPTLITKKDGTYAYCIECTKKLYPNYRNVFIKSNSINPFAS